MKTQVDITTLNAIESIFHHGQSDPWARTLAGELADAYIYSHELRIPIPTESGELEEKALQSPALLASLVTSDRSLVKGFPFASAERRIATDIVGAAQAFEHWAMNNLDRYRSWAQLHRAKWLRSGHDKRIPERYFYDVDRAKSLLAVSKLAAAVALPVEEPLYALDVIMRYPFYGEMVPGGASYLAHPIRTQVPLTGLTLEPYKPPTVPVRFAPEIAKIANSLSADEYLSILTELRRIAWDSSTGFVGMAPGAISPERLRQIARAVNLPAHMPATAKALGVVTGLLTVAAAIQSAAIPAAIVGGIVTVASSFWQGGLHRGIARWSWLQWAATYDLEAQGRNAQQ